MPFPTLSRYQVATLATRSRWKLRHVTNFITTTTQKVSSSSSTSSTLSLSTHKTIRTESLRSTWMTDDNDSMADPDPNLDEQLVVQDNCNELQIVVHPQSPLSDWVYWQRDAVALPDCWTRVFAVFCDNVLWLYRYEDASAKSLLVRMCVTALDIGEDTRQLQFQDGETTSNVQLCLPDASAFYRWHRHVARAVTAFPLVKEETNVAIVSTMTSAMQKKSLWREVATAVLKGSKIRCGTHEEDEIVLYNRQSRKSFGQRWTNVTTALKSALKLDHRFS